MPSVSNLAALRKAAGLSTRQLAARSGVTQAVVSRYEHWHAPKGLKSALAIAAALRVPALAIWPDARPQPNTKHRPSKAAGGKRTRAKKSAETLASTKG